MANVTTVDTKWGISIRCRVSEGRTVYFSGFDREYAQLRGIVFKSLNQQCEDHCEIKRDSIPTEIACMGRAAIASYIFSVHGEPYEEVATQLGVSVETVRQYIFDFRHGRR